MCVVMCVADMVLGCGSDRLQNADAVALPSMLKPYAIYRLNGPTTYFTPTNTTDDGASSHTDRQLINKVPAVYTLRL